VKHEASFEETPGRIDVALAIPIREGKMLVARRLQGTHLAGHWEFPGGKIDHGEDPARAAARELLEETGLRADDLEPLVLLVHDYADRPLRFHVFLAREPDGELRGDEPRWVWKTLTELEQLRMPDANRQMLRALRWRV
jgi:8-oxo-dGTP diphosphatase